LRSRNGTITTFDYPGINQGTFPFGITPSGTIMGNYFSNNQYHGFTRTCKGTFATFDPPGSLGTQPSAINQDGAITGYYFDASFVAGGFLKNSTQDDTEGCGGDD
jgi:hypothetical protein